MAGDNADKVCLIIEECGGVCNLFPFDGHSMPKSVTSLNINVPTCCNFLVLCNFFVLFPINCNMV